MFHSSLGLTGSGCGSGSLVHFLSPVQEGVVFTSRNGPLHPPPHTWGRSKNQASGRTCSSRFAPSCLHHHRPTSRPLKISHPSQLRLGHFPATSLGRTERPAVKRECYSAAGQGGRANAEVSDGALVHFTTAFSPPVPSFFPADRSLKRCHDGKTLGHFSVVRTRSLPPGPKPPRPSQ